MTTAAHKELTDMQDPLMAEFDAERQQQQQRRTTGPQPASSEDDDAPVEEMRGRLHTPDALRRFILAGRAIVTFVSRKSGDRMTFRFTQPKPEPGRVAPIWVSVLSGPDNNASYTFLGSMWPNGGSGIYTFRRGRKCTITEDAPSMRFANWLVKGLNVAPAKILEQAEAWHEGRCGRCGRRLTVPQSIESGFGPECITHI